MSAELAKALHAVPETRWKAFGHDRDGTVRQWAELGFFPGETEKTEKKDIQPLQWVALRLTKAQGELIDWNRAKAGMLDHVHYEMKNSLAVGQPPSPKLGANAAWLHIARIAFNILLTLRKAWPDEAIRNAHSKRLRFVIFGVSGSFVRDRRKLSPRFAASTQWNQKAPAHCAPENALCAPTIGRRRRCPSPTENLTRGFGRNICT